jgi:hypothetical protein
MPRGDSLPTVTVTWGRPLPLREGEARVRSEALCQLVGFIAEVEENAIDGGDRKPGGQFNGAAWTINGVQAFLADACLAIKAVHRVFMRHQVPRIVDDGVDKA